MGTEGEKGVMGGGERGRELGKEGRREGCIMALGGWTPLSVSAAVFNIMGPKHWGHDLDLSRSRDVIELVTIRFAICLQFPIGGSLEPKLYLQSLSRYSGPKLVHSGRHTHNSKTVYR